MADNRTEKATPKKRDEARKKGQVARSADLNGAVVLFASLIGLAAFAPSIWENVQGAMRHALALAASPEIVDAGSVGALFAATGRSVALSVLPICMLAALAGVCTSVAQVGFKPTPSALKPDFKRINPLSGLKNLLGPNTLFEGTKTILKFAAVGGVAALAVFPALPELAALVGMPPAALVPEIASTILGVCLRAAGAYLVIAAADYLWQRHRHEKQLRMNKQEVKDEFKQQGLPAEVRSAQRRRQMQLAQARMMDDVPHADVVVTNPTHYSVALRYDGAKLAPEVVAKGQDLIALRIREIAREHGVPVVPDPPLARSLHASVEVGHQIPEELFQAVAQLLAYVYRIAGRRAV